MKQSDLFIESGDMGTWYKSFGLKIDHLNFKISVTVIDHLLDLDVPLSFDLEQSLDHIFGVDMGKSRFYPTRQIFDA